jgi:hypothetical protein
MRKIASMVLAGALAVAGLGLTTDQGQARHRDGFSFGLSFGSPYPYHQRYYRPYPREYYVYRPAPRRAYRSDWGAHVAWCYDRWRSYREYDNSYQPFNGPRRECRSPFYG